MLGRSHTVVHSTAFPGRLPRAAVSSLWPLYVQRLVLAAEVHDAAEIDAITDELAEHYPELVRLRSARSRFGSAAEEVAAGSAAEGSA